MYNPSQPGIKGRLFGFPYTEEEASVVVVQVPLDVTTSYGDGTSLAPALIVRESYQLDLSVPHVDSPWDMKQVAISPLQDLVKENHEVREMAKAIMNRLESGKQADKEHLAQVNAFCEKVHNVVERECEQLIQEDKIVGILGGDHSSSLGLIRALAKKNVEFGILQLDAHQDLRIAYEGFEYSHASCMYQALGEKRVSNLVQVGIRDFCEEEEEYVQRSTKPIDVFMDEDMVRQEWQGRLWPRQVEHIISKLPSNVYMTLDVDGLEPSLCPNTGTPVPGGLSFYSVTYLLERLVKSGRKIIGFDVCETGNGIWDANVSARLLYRAAIYTGISNGLLRFS